VRTLIVAPVADGSGETITALHVAERLAARGGTVGFLASPFARRFIESRFPDPIWALNDDGSHNVVQWNRALAEMRPDIVLFADYPLMFFPRGCVPLGHEPGWAASLESVSAILVTLDHFGFAQGAEERGFFMGPPHLGFAAYYRLPALPAAMKVMLPCPMHEPGAVDGRVGEPFRYWDVPLSLPAADRDEVRRKFGLRDGDRLVFHSVPNWAVKATAQLGLPFYWYLPDLLDFYFEDLEAPVVIVSVNDGSLLRASPGSSVRITSLGPVPPAEFEALLLGADLVVTENKLSISMGKAVCALRPCAVLTNGYRLIELAERAEGRTREVLFAMERARLGSVYRYAVFPSVTPEDIDVIGLYRGNRLSRAFREFEVFGGDETRQAFRRLLFDGDERAALRARQQEYVEAVRLLPDSAAVLYNIRERGRESQ
jgi:Family of unknown function (DUF6365)